MPKLFAAVLTLMLTFFLLSTAFAVSKQPAKIKTDTSKIQVKSFDAHAIAKFRVNKVFKYNGNAREEVSIWDVFWDWLWNAIGNFFNRIPFGGTVVKYFFLAAAATLLIFVIFKSLGIDPVRILRGESPKTNVPYSESLENIHEINFDDEIEKAITLHNYRLAVRLQYLKCLKQLSDNNLIHWQIDKTNAAYLYELQDPEQKQIFSLLTKQFEYAWYGNFIIDKQAFNGINQLFQTFKNRLP
ncbi:MAG: hypothetical protein JWP44_973 [Mucilaginibacter sp.]|nr:hypothetical protein [Mucilaginibacter sp.]